MDVTKVVDAKGLACPMPIVQAKQAMDQLEVNEVLEIHATDAGSEQDLVSWAEAVGHELLQKEIDDGVFKFWIKRKK